MTPFTNFRRSSLAFVGLVAFLVVAVAEEVPRDESGFTQFVAAQVRTQLSDAEIVVKGPLTIAIGELQTNLDRIFTFCLRNGSRCSAEIDNYVTGVSETYRGQHLPPTKDAVRFVVRTAEYVDILTLGGYGISAHANAATAVCRRVVCSAGN